MPLSRGAAKRKFPPLIENGTFESHAGLGCDDLTCPCGNDVALDGGEGGAYIQHLLHLLYKSCTGHTRGNVQIATQDTTFQVIEADSYL